MGDSLSTLALPVICLCFLMLTAAARRYLASGRAINGTLISVEERTPLAPGTFAALMRVRGNELLIAVSPNAITIYPLPNVTAAPAEEVA